MHSMGTRAIKGTTRRWPKPVAWAAAVALSVGGLITVQQVLEEPPAAQAYQSNQGTISINWAQNGSVNASGSLAGRAPVFDDATLYDASTSEIFTLATNHQVPTSVVQTSIINQGCDSCSTIAVDGVNGYGYFWPWTDGTTVRRIKSGETRIYQITNVPSSRDSRFTEPAGTAGWSGGEVDQRNGNIIFSPREGQGLGAGARWMILNPTTGEYNFSGKVQPNTAADNIFGTANNTTTGQGGVGSDMAIDAEGNIYAIVNSNTAVPSMGVAAGEKLWLVRIVPATNGLPWKYNLVTPFTGIGAELVYGMAFYEGSLYFSRSSIEQVNPMTSVATRLGTRSGTSRDLASGQTAYVIKGQVFYDANADGVEDAPSGGQPVALYWKNNAGQYIYEGRRFTDDAGNYSFIVGGTGDYIVRLVRPKVNPQSGDDFGDFSDYGVNAMLTAASAYDGGGNTVTAYCVDAPGGTRTAAGLWGCAGAKAVPYTDPSMLGYAGTTVTDPADMAIYSLIHLTNTDTVPEADFVITAAGSFGDSKGGVTTFGTSSATQGPVHVNGANPQVWLGDKIGLYANGATDDKAHDATDDGVWITANTNVGGKIVPADDVLAAGKVYTLNATVSGPKAASASVKGWVTNANGTALGAGTRTYETAASWNPVMSGSTWSSAWSPSTTKSGLAAPAYANLRVNASLQSASASDNRNNEYQSSILSDATTTWVTTGEVEDYAYKVAAAVYRPAVISEGGTGTFTLGGQNLTTNVAGLPVLGKGLGVAADSTNNMTVVLPNTNWMVKKVELIDTLTGNPATTQPTLTGSGVNWTINGVKPALNDDLTVRLTVAKRPGPENSALRLSPATAPAGSPITATATINDGDGNPLTGTTVLFSVPSGVTIKDMAGASQDGSGNPIDSCVTAADGTCSVKLSANVAGSYAVSAKIETAAGTWTNVTDVAHGGAGSSPQNAIWTAGEPDPARSQFTIDKAGPLQVGTEVANAYILTAVIRDAQNNVRPSTEVTFSVTNPNGNQPVLSDYTCITTDGSIPGQIKGVCMIMVTSTKAGTFEFNAKVSVAGVLTPLGGNGQGASYASPQSRTWTPAPPCVKNATDCPDGSEMTIAPFDNVIGRTPAVATITLKDANGNAISGYSQADMNFSNAGGLTLTNFTENPAGSGIYKLNLAHDATGTYVLSARPNGLVGAGTLSSQVAFGPAGADPALSTFTINKTGPLTVGATAANAYTLRVTAYDGQGTANSGRGNLVPGTSVVFEADPPVAGGQPSFESYTCDTGAAGWCEVTVTSTKAGSYNFTATISSAPVGANLSDATLKSPQTRVWNPAPVDASNTSITINGEAAANNVAMGSNAQVAVVLKDAYGNAIRGQSFGNLGISASPAGLTIDQASLTELAGADAGTYTFNVTSATAGTTFTVTTAPGNGVTKSATVNFRPGVADPAKSLFTVTPAGPLEPGNTTANAYTLAVTAYDGQGSANSGLGNPVEGAVVSFEVSPQAANQPALESDTCTTLANGACSITVTSTRVGTYELAAKIAGVPVGGPNNGTGDNDSPKSREWKAMTPDKAHSTIQVTPASQEINQNSAVKVCLKDALGNPVLGKSYANLGLSATPAGLSFNVGSFAELAGADAGCYTVNVTSATVTTYIVAQQPTGWSAPNTAQVQFGSSVAKAEYSVFAIDQSGPLPVGAAAGSRYTLTVTAYDGSGSANAGKGNLVGGQSVAFSVSPSGPVLSAPTCATATSGATQGQCSVTVYSTKAGNFELHALIGGSDIGTPDGSLNGPGGDSPQTRTWLASPVVDPAFSSIRLVTSDWTTDQDVIGAGVAAYALVTLKDSYENPVTGYTTSELHLSASPSTGVQFSAADQGDGTYRVNLPAGFRTSGLNQVTANPYKAPEVTGPFVRDSILVTAGQPDDTNTTFAITPVSLLVGNQATATLTVRDINNNPVTGLSAAVTLTLPAGLNKVAGYALPTEDQPGVYTWKLISAVDGTYPVQANVPAAPANLAKQANVTYTLDLPSRVDLSVNPFDVPVSATAAAGTAKLNISVFAGSAPVRGLNAGDFVFNFYRKNVQEGTYSAGNSNGSVKTDPLRCGELDQAGQIHTVDFVGTLNGTGVYACYVGSSLQGTYGATVTVAGIGNDLVAGTPVKKDVKFFSINPPRPETVGWEICQGTTGPGSVDPGWTGWRACVAPLGANAATVNGQVRGWFTAKDEFGNGVPLTDAQISLAGSGYNASGVKKAGSFIGVNDNYGDPSGYYYVQLTSANSGVFGVTAATTTTTGTHTMPAASAEFKWADAKVTLSLNPASAPVSTAANATMKAKVHVETTLGAPINDLDPALISFGSDPTGPALKPGSCLRAATAGDYECYLYSTLKDTFAITATAGSHGDSAAVNGTFTNDPATPTGDDKIEFEITESWVYKSDPATAVVYLSDKFGNCVDSQSTRISISSVPAGVTATYVGENTAPDSVCRGAGGAYSYTVTANPAGSQTVDYAVKATWSAAPYQATDNLQVRSRIGDPDPAASKVTTRPTAGSPVYVGSITTGATWTVRIELKDAGNQAISGKANDLQVSFADSTVYVRQPVVETSTPGTYEVLVSSTKSGTFPVDVTAQSVALNDHPVVTFTAGPGIDVTKSHLSASPVTQTAGAQVIVTYEVRDLYNNPVDYLTAGDFAIAGAVQAGSAPGITAPIPGTFNDNAAASEGKYLFAITSQQAGSFQLTGSVKGTELMDHPRVNFVAGEVCVTNCQVSNPYTHVEMVTNGQLANGMARDTAKAYVYDTYGNPVLGATVVANRQDAELSPATQTTVTAADGTADLSWTANTAGQYTATVTVDNKTGFPGAVLNSISFTSGAVDPAKSALQVTPASPLAAGGSYTLTVTARDASNNTVGGATVAFAITPAAGQTWSATTCQTRESDGACSVQVTSTQAGAYLASAKVTNASGQLLDVSGSPASVAWTAAAVCVPPDPNCSADPALQTRVVVTKPDQLANGTDEDEATVYAFDRYGNPVGAVQWVASTTDAGLRIVNSSGTTGVDGQSVVRFTSQVEGAHPATFLVAGQPLPAVSLNFTNVPVGSATLSITGDATVPVGQNITAKAQVRNTAGLPASGVTVYFATSDPAASFVGANSCVTVNGECSVQLTAQVAGDYQVRFQPNPAGTVTGSPADVHFTAGAVDGARSEVDIVTNDQANDGIARDIVRVIAKDQYGNLINGAVVASTSSNANINIQSAIPATGAGGEKGVSQIGYTSLVAGAYQVNVTVNGVTVTGGLGSPLTLNFGVTDGDPLRSTWTIAPQQATLAQPLVVGTGSISTYVLTATVRNVLNAPVPGAGVTFSVDPAGPRWGSGNYSCTTNAQGQCTVSLYSTVSGSFDVTAKIAAGIIPSNKGASWKPDEVCGANCTPDPTTPVDKYTRVEIVTNEAVADGIATDQLRVLAFDKYGNPVENQFVTSASTDNRIKVQDGIPATGDGRNGTTKGATIINYTSQVAGVQYPVTVMVGEPGLMQQPRQVPVNLTFKYDCIPGVDANCSPLPGVGQVSHIEITTNGVMADGTSTDQIQVYVFDRQGTPVADKDIRVTPPAGVTAVPATAKTNATGAATVNFTSATAGDHAVKVDVNSLGVWNELVIPAGVTPRPPAEWKSSPVTINFVSGRPDPAKSHLTVAPSSQVAGSPVKVTYEVRDQSNNPIAHLTAADFTIAGAPQAGSSAPALTAFVPGTFVNAADGKYTFELTSRQAGSFRLTGQVSGIELIDHPSVSFTAGDVCVSNCDPSSTNYTHVVMVNNGQLANGTARDTAKAYAYDTYGNPVAGATVVATRQSAELSPASQTVTTGADGTADLYWTSSSDGQFTATVQVDNKSGFPGSVLNDINFTVGAVSATSSALVVAPASPVRAGQAYTLTVTARDASNNTVGGAAVQFDIAKIGGTAGQAPTWSAKSCITKRDEPGKGTCSVQVTATEAGLYDVRATVTVNANQVEVAGSPARVEWTAATVCVPSVDPGCSADPARQTRVEVTKPNQLANGTDADEATVYTFDRYGNPAAGIQWAAATTDAGLQIVNPAGTTGTDGQSVVQFTSTVEGAHPATFLVDGKPVPAVSLNFTNVPVGSAALSVVGNATVQAGQTITVKASVLNTAQLPANGVAVSFATSNPAVTFAGGNSCVTVNGECSVRITSEVAGDYQVRFQSDPAAVVSGSPADVRFTAAAVDGAMSEVRIVLNDQANDGIARDIVRVIAKDRFGNLVDGARVASSSNNANISIQANIPVTGADGEKGISQIGYTSLVAGAYPVNITVNGVAPAAGLGSPVTLNFGVTDGDTTQSSWTIAPQQATLAQPLTVGTGAASTYVLTATVKNVLGAPVQNAGVTFSVDPAAGPRWGSGNYSCTTNAQGACSVSLYSTTSGSYSVMASIAAGIIPTNKAASWKPDEVCGVNCTPDPTTPVEKYSRVEVVRDNAPADGTTANQLKVLAFDRFGNPVANQYVTSSSTDARIKVQTGVPATGDGLGGTTPGVAIINYTSTLADVPFPVTVMVGQPGEMQQPRQVPVNLTFSHDCIPGVDANCDPLPGVGQVSHIEVVTDRALANGVATDEIKVALVDRQGNPVANLPIRVTTGDDVRPTVVTRSLNAQTPTNANGQATFTFTSRVPGDHQVVAEAYSLGVWRQIVIPAGVAPVPPATWKSSPVTINFAADLPCRPADPNCPDPNVDDQHRSRLVITANNQRANGTDTDQIAVYLFGQTGLPVPGITVVATTTDSNAKIVQPIAATDANGRTVINVKSNKYGDTQPITIKWVDPGDNTSYEVVYKPQNPAAPVAGFLSSPVKLHFVAESCVTNPDNCVPSPVITSPSDGDAVNSGRPEFIGTGEPGAEVVIKDGGKVIGQTTVDPNGNWSFTPATPLPDGNHSITAEQKDQGYTSEPTPPIVIEVDTQAPKAPVVTSPKDGEPLNNNQPKVEGTGEPGTEITVKDGNGNTLCSATAAANGAWSCTVPPEMALPEGGPQELHVDSTDKAGNHSPETVIRIPEVDTTAPAGPCDPLNPVAGCLSMTSPREGQAINQPKAEFAGTGEPGAKVVVKEGNTEICVATIAASGQWSCTANINLGEGPHTVTVTQQDRAGNVSTPPLSRNFTVDTVKPAPPTVDYPISGGAFNPNFPVSGGNGEPGSSVVVDAGNGNKCTALVGPDGKWSCKLPMVPPDGTPMDLVVNQVDPAGNVSDDKKIHVDVDTTAPGAPTVDTSDDNKVTGEAEPGTDITVKDGNGKTLCSAKADADGNYSCETSRPLKPGEEIKVSSKDSAGNTTTTVVRKLSLIVAKPSIPLAQDQIFTGHYFKSGEMVRAYVDGQEIGSQIANAEGTVVFIWQVPESTGLGQHEVKLVGATSGPVLGKFMATNKLPATGATATWALLAGAGVATLLGIGLLLFAHKRKDEDEAGQLS